MPYRYDYDDGRGYGHVIGLSPADLAKQLLARAADMTAAAEALIRGDR